MQSYFVNKTITIETIVNAPLEQVWSSWTLPSHVVNWCFASLDWHVPHAVNDLRVGGKFTTVMAAKDGSTSFDFNGVYTNVEQFKMIDYTIEGGRKVSVRFEDMGDRVRVEEVFEMEDENSEEMQRAGWQSILENFKVYTEGIKLGE